MSNLTVIEAILRDRRSFFREIREGIGLRDKMRAMLVSSIVFLAIYGAVLGSTHSLWQALSSGVKLPLLFLATLVVCAPTLYFFNLIFGSNQSLGQNVALMLTAITVTSVVLLSFAPIVLFFLLTSASYQFFKLLNVGIFTVAGRDRRDVPGAGDAHRLGRGQGRRARPAPGGAAVDPGLCLCRQPDGLDAAALHRRAEHEVRAVPPARRQLLRQHLRQPGRVPGLLHGEVSHDVTRSLSTSSACSTRSPTRSRSGYRRAPRLRTGLPCRTWRLTRRQQGQALPSATPASPAPAKATGAPAAAAIAAGDVAAAAPEPEAEPEQPAPQLPARYVSRFIARIAVFTLVALVLINIPFNRQGLTLATALPDSAALVIRDGLVVKPAGSPDIYVMQGGKFRWISSLDAFEHYGFRWQQVRDVQADFLSEFEVGAPLHVLVKCPDSPHIYRLEKGIKRWILDIATFTAEGHVWEDVRIISCWDLRNYPDGETIPPGHGPAPQP